MTPLLELVDRVEKAEGPDREIDKAIARLLGTGHWVDREGEADYGVFGDKEWWVASYTASLDAAMTLVPEGYHPSVVLRQGIDACIIAVGQDRAEFIRRLPAFVTAAALRARASMETPS
jgi:hypothetical protein